MRLTLAFLLLADVAVAADRYFSEDHLTGAAYLLVARTGTYHAWSQEHMGVFDVDEGRWSVRAGNIEFASSRTKGARFSAREGRFKGRTFLIFKGQEAPSIEIPESEIRQELTTDEKATPSYVFFAVSQAVFEGALGDTYPFKYFPEMNKRKKVQKPAAEQ